MTRQLGHGGRHRRRAFTLLEVMIAVAILGIFSAMAIGGLGPMITSLQVREAGVQGAEAVARAREEARGSGRYYRVEVVNGTSLADAVPVVGSANGNALRLSRWSSADTSDLTAPVPAPVPDEFIAIASNTQVRFSATSTNPLIWGNNGRLQSGATTLEFLSDGVNAVVSTIIEVQGPVCVFDTAAIGTCP